MVQPKTPTEFKTENSFKKDMRSHTLNNSEEIRNSMDSSTKDSSAVVSTTDSLSVRTSDSSKRDTLIRDSRTSSGIVICEKTSIEEKKERKRERKVYTQSRQSERIRRNRLEIDGEPPVEFLSLPYVTGKRKRGAGVDIFTDTPKTKVRKTSATAPTRKGRKIVNR